MKSICNPFYQREEDDPKEKKHKYPFLQGQFQKSKTLDTRINEATMIMQRYPERFPIIIEYTPIAAETFKKLTRQKYLVPGNITLGQFIFIIRERLIIPKETALFTFVGNKTLPNITTTMDKLYELYKDDDLFLYIIFTIESTFGNTNTFELNFKKKDSS